MNENYKCTVGRDESSVFIALMIAVLVICVIAAIVIYGGMFIGGFYSLKNYLLSFKENVIDANNVLGVA